MRIVVTSDIVSDVLYVSRVEHPDYPGYDRLKTVSKDELISSFCEEEVFWDIQRAEKNLYFRSESATFA